MVLESLTTPAEAEKRPYQMMILGFLYSSVAILLSLWIFYEYSSLIMVFLTVFACIPIIYNTIKLEEKKDEEQTNEWILLKEHSKAVKSFFYLFLGITISMSLWYVFLPAGKVTVLYSTQTQTIQSINTGVIGMAAKLDDFSRIFLNNIKVLMFCILFSFIYGVGAIFILAWNASVIGAAIGSFIRRNLAGVSQKAGFVKVAAYFQVFSIGFLKYALHGIPEILAYFVGGLAGGIISVAVVRHTFGTKKFETVLWDSSDMILIAIALLFVAGLLEVFVTPMIF